LRNERVVTCLPTKFQVQSELGENNSSESLIPTEEGLTSKGVEMGG